MMSFRMFGTLLPGVTLIVAGLFYLLGTWWGGASVGALVSLLGVLATLFIIPLSISKLVHKDAESYPGGELYILATVTFILLTLFVVLIGHSSPWYCTVAAAVVWFFFSVSLHSHTKSSKNYGSLLDSKKWEETFGTSLAGWPIAIAIGFTLHYFGLHLVAIVTYLLLTAFNTLLAAFAFGYFQTHKVQA